MPDPSSPENAETRRVVTENLIDDLLAQKENVPDFVEWHTQERDKMKKILRELIEKRDRNFDALYGDNQVIMGERARITEGIQKIDKVLCGVYTEYDDLRKDLEELARDFLQGERDLPPEKPGQN